MIVNKVNQVDPKEIAYRLGKRMMGGLAFYDFDPKKLDLKNAFYDTLDFMQKHKIEGHLLESNYHQKRVLVRNGIKALEKKGFESAEYIGVEAVKEGSGLDSWHDGWDYSFSLSKTEDPLSFFCFDLDLFPFSNAFYENLTLTHLKFCDFKYAFYYEKEFCYGPDSYAAGGTSNGGKSKEDNKRIGRWSNRYNAHFKEINPEDDYYTGLLRDIYPINILIQEHLNQRVGKGTLQDWITSGPHRGALHQLTDKHTSWRIPHEDIDSIRQALIPWRLLVAFNEIDCTPRTMTPQEVARLIAEGK